MSDDNIPDELRELYAAASSAPKPDATVRSAVRARVVASVHSTAALALAAKGLAVLALTIGGALLVRHGSRPAPTQPVATVPAAPTASLEVSAQQRPNPPAEVTTSLPGTESGVAGDPVASHETRSPTSGRVPARRTKTLTAPVPAHRPEVEIIRNAWTALSADQPNHVLTLVDEAETGYPTGALVEEREVLRVAALAALGRQAEATAAAQAFLARYPESVHRALIERSLKDSSDLQTTR